MAKPQHSKKHVSQMNKNEKKSIEKDKKLQYKNASMITKAKRSGKHKKIKTVDPFYVGNRTLKKNIEKKNFKPSSSEADQELSNAEKEFMRIRNLARELPKSKLKGKQDPFHTVAKEDTQGMTKRITKTPHFNQGVRETDRDFNKRIHIATQRAIATAQFQEEFDVDVDEKGNVIKERTKTAEKNAKRLQAKKLRKKEKVLDKKREKEEGFEKYQDKVEFGEVAMAPPQLGSKPRKGKLEYEKPGKRSLLLKSIIQENSTSGITVPQSVRKVGETQKRKNMSMARQVIMDKERSNAIEMYRAMKAKKMIKKT